jgi:hypothetical protein
MDLKSRAVPALLIGGVVLAGGGAVVAASGGSSSPGSAAKTQYCKNGGHGKKCKPKKPKPKIHTHQRHRGRCYATTFTMNVTIANKPAGHSAFVYRDGHRIRRTQHNHFTVRTNVRKLKRGPHSIKVRVRDAGGRWVTRTVHFRRC